LWSKKLGQMLDLGTIQGDVVSAALGINDEGNVVGASLDEDGSPRAFLFAKGRMKDLNALVPPDSAIYMLIPYAINSKGQVAGFGVTGSGEIHGFLASPCAVDSADPTWCRRGSADWETEKDATSQRSRPFLSEDLRERVRHTMHAGIIGRFIGQQ